ncbi:MAG: hypothetical protein DRP09_18680, partial [Candidatus Thorarchaeota archaeon]
MHGDFDIALDSEGHPHLSFIKDDDLKYTWYDGTAWHTETIDSEQYRYFKAPSISIDTNDHPHITYHETSDAHLKYAWYDGSSWYIRIIDNDGRAGKSSSLVVDSSGKPHVGYIRYDGIYYTGFDGAWSAPAAPSNLTAKPVSSQQIELNWTDNSANEDGFRIEYGEEPGDWKEFATVGSGVTTYNDIIVLSGSTYYFRLRAHNFVGNSGYSNAAGATAPDQPPPVFDSSSATLTNSYMAGQKGFFSTYAGYGSISGCSRYIKAVNTETIDGVECLRFLVKGNGNHPDPDQDPQWTSICLAEDTGQNIWLFEFHMVNGSEEQRITFDTDSAVLWMPVNPQDGDIFRQFGFNEYNQVVETGVTVQQLNTGQGPYTDCIKLTGSGENDINIEYHCPGSGTVRELYQGWGDTNIWEIDQNSSLNPGDVMGTVFEYAGGQATGLEGALITILETGQTATSGVTGYFSFSGDVIAGTYTIKIEKDDYFTTVMNSVAISEGQITSIPSEDTTLYPEQTYRFERMWPTLQQPWYFYYPNGIATDRLDNVYVASPGIQKYNANGQFITGWKVYEQDGETPCYPVGIATDSEGNVYITEPTEDSIRKYSPAGRFITRWGSGGTENGEFDYPNGIALNNNGDVYVVDSNNYRVQKFSSDGEFILKWGGWGQDNGQFYMPNRIAIDSDGYVYVSDWSLHRVQKFGPNGTYITKWGSEGNGDGQFNRIDGLSVSENGDVYVADNGDINDPGDTDNYRIQKFSPVDDGNGGYNYVFDTAWGSKGKADGEFNYLRDITIDRNGNLYAVDSGLGYEPETVESHRIQKFTLDGQFITTWGSQGNGPGNFFGPAMIAVDSSGNAYVSEQGNDRIQKFSAEGEFLLEWGSEGTGNGQFKDPFGIVIDG